MQKMTRFNSLVLSLGSNLGDKKLNLTKATLELSKHFVETSRSSFYSSSPVDYLEQDEFLNMVVEYQIPTKRPIEVLTLIQSIENKMGRIKLIDKGPRNIDIDIIFWGEMKIKSQQLIIPHLSYQDRSFVCIPLQELSSYDKIKACFDIPTSFHSSCIKL